MIGSNRSHVASYTVVRLTDSDKEDIIRMHKEGWSNFQIADYIGCSPTAVRNYLLKAYPEYKDSRNYINPIVANKINDYNAGMSYRKIAEKYNLKDYKIVSCTLCRYRKKYPELFNERRKHAKI